ncbi:MAG: hypothetical protein ACM3TR_09235 [Caulobacteraceae bacterium]
MNRNSFASVGSVVCNAIVFFADGHFMPKISYHGPGLNNIK